jgi:hypothetical protein
MFKDSMMKKLTYFLAAIMMLVYASCSSTSDKEKATEAEAIEPVEEWIWLFDGESTDGWRGFNSEGLPEGWVLEEGTLKSLGQGGDIGGDIVYGNKEFENFELHMEWKISTAGNSGIFYHVQEGEKYHAPYENAPEYQLIDDIGFPDPLEGWQKLAADYAMYAAPEDKPIKPAGEWNTSRIIFTPEKVSYFLNDVKVVEFVPWSDDWHERRMQGKWKDSNDYGKAKTGFIGLQDHGSFIWFKNIKIKEL